MRAIVLRITFFRNASRYHTVHRLRNIYCELVMPEKAGQLGFRDVGTRHTQHSLSAV